MYHKFKNIFGYNSCFTWCENYLWSMLECEGTFKIWICECDRLELWEVCENEHDWVEGSPGVEGCPHWFCTICTECRINSCSFAWEQFPNISMYAITENKFNKTRNNNKN